MWTMHGLLQHCSTHLGNVNAERDYVEEKVMLVYMLCYWCKQYCKYNNRCGKES